MAQTTGCDDHFWANAIFRGDKDGSKEHAKSGIQNWLKTQIRRKLQNAAKENVITIDNWTPLPASTPTEGSRPTYDLQDFSMCFPSSARLLPLRQSFLDMAAEKFQGMSPVKVLFDEWVLGYNKKWNPTGVAHQNKRPAPSAESPRPRTQAKIIQVEEVEPTDLKKLKEKKGKLVTFEHQGQTICITPDGEMWIWGVNDGEVTLDDAVTLAWGEFKVGEEAMGLLETSPLRVWLFAIESADHEGGYATKGVTTGDQAFLPLLGPFSTFLEHFGGQVRGQL